MIKIKRQKSGQKYASAEKNKHNNND